MSFDRTRVPRTGGLAVAAYRRELARARSEWWRRVLASGAADRKLAEAAITALYTAARSGRRKPDVVWCGSPLALVQAAESLGGGDDIADEIAYRRLRRELAAIAGRTTKGYRFRSHFLAELQDERARRVSEDLWHSVFDAVKVSERSAWEATRGSVWDYFLYGGDIEVRETLQPEFLGALALPQFLHDHWGFGSSARAVCDLVRSCGGFVLREELAILSERHSRLSLDREGRLHDEHGPAVIWPDGFAVYAWHGIRVPREVITDPESVDTKAVLAEPNLEVRRVLIERLGYERLISGLRLKPVAKDRSGRLWRVDLSPDEPLVLVEVENATREVDGTRRRYFLRVPPDIETAREAVAWTFGLPTESYRPLSET